MLGLLGLLIPISAPTPLSLELAIHMSDKEQWLLMQAHGSGFGGPGASGGPPKAGSPWSSYRLTPFSAQLVSCLPNHGQ